MIASAESEIHIVARKEEFIVIVESSSNASQRNSYLLNLFM